MHPRPLRRIPLSAFILGASCLALGVSACTPARTPESASQAAAATAAEATSETPELQTRFAGVMPRGLTTVGAATMGDALYLVGGYFGSPHDYSKEFQSGSVQRLHLSTGVWEELAGVEPVQSPAVVGDGKYLYKIGGLKALNAAGQPTELRSLAEVERFDPGRNRWEPIPSLPEPRSSHQAVVVDGKLYVVGGWELVGGMNDNTWKSTMLVADLKQPTLTWQSVEVPFQVRAMAVTALGRGIYVLGGLSPEGGTDRVHRFDIATGKWSDGQSLPEENLTTRAAVYKGRLYANGADGHVYRLSDDELRWERTGSVAFPRLFHEMVPSERGPLVLAGIPDNGRGTRVRVIERLSEEPAPAGVILNMESASPAKNRQGAFLWSQQLFVFGGNNSLGQYDLGANNFERGAARIDLGALEWRPVPDFPAARQSMQASVIGKDEESALVVGGFGFTDNDVLGASAEVFRHDIMKKEWVSLGALLPVGRSEFHVAEWGEALWLFGGMTFDGRREPGEQIQQPTQVLKLELGRASGKFEDAGVALGEPRRAFAGALLEGTYYLVGGIRQDFQAVTSCEAIDLAAKQVRPMPCPAEPRLGAELVALGGKLYLVGGSFAADRSERKPATSIEVFDPKSESWTALPSPLPIDSGEQLRAFAFNDQLLLYSAHRTDPTVQVALLDPAALAAGRRDYLRMNVPKPVQ